eukprot:m.79193 g.79193  ORF g.79193 m.79193 type:complete len:51 (-) comp10781_c2_seq1:285-437(-)
MTSEAGCAHCGNGSSQDHDIVIAQTFSRPTAVVTVQPRGVTLCDDSITEE